MVLQRAIYTIQELPGHSILYIDLNLTQNVTMLADPGGRGHIKVLPVSRAYPGLHCILT